MDTNSGDGLRIATEKARILMHGPAILLISLTVSTSIGQPRSVAIRPLASPQCADGTPVPQRPSLEYVITQAASHLPEKHRLALADKPSPYIVNAHDVGLPTDFHKDVPWHLLDKEKDERLDLPHRGDLGLANLSADISWRIGIAVDDGPVCFNPKRRYTHHLVNLAVSELEIEGFAGRVALLPVTSDTSVAIVELASTLDRSHTVRLRSACVRPHVENRPIDRHGYGIHVTCGALQWVGFNQPNNALIMAFDDWDRQNDRPVGTLLCTMGGSISPQGIEALGGSEAHPEHAAWIEYHIPIEPRRAVTVALAVNLHRFGPQRVETRRQVVLWPRETEEQALTHAVGAVSSALRNDWPALMAASFDWYQRLFRLALPDDRWTADVYCALELPRANTWSAQERMTVPWYTFCRAHGHDAFGWWSYGMHGHEHLATFTVNVTEPSLSASYLRGHFHSQRADGFVPYGVNHRGVNIHRGLATCPLLMMEAWTAYTWSGDRAFLAEAFDCGSRSLQWWRSGNRTRDGTSLQHWKDYVETVRDDADLPTWTATDAAENQEALDLNCYLLNEERALAAMARVLGRDGDAIRWQELVDQRRALMRRNLLHPQDGLFYGRDTLSGRWARVLDISTFFPMLCGLASVDEADRIVDLLDDAQAFGTPYPVATLAVEHMPDRLRGQYHWRGANWVQMTWLVVLGLKQYGYYDEAARLAEINCRMVFDTLERTGHFREYYNTLTGTPTDLTDYIWASIPAIMVIDVFFGIRPTADGLDILPALPEGWLAITLDGLRVRHAKVSLDIQRNKNANAAAVTLNGKSLSVCDGRGAFVSWDDLPDHCDIHIVQPMKIVQDIRQRSLFDSRDP